MKKLLFIVTLCVFGFNFITSASLSGQTVVIMETNQGDITIELYNDQTPITVDNFLDYALNGFYDGVIFHRVMDDFMIQAGIYDTNLYEADFGDPNFSLDDPNFTRQPNDPIVDEFVEGLENVRGTLAMANAGPNTGSSQFFINQKSTGNPHLNGVHTVFGGVLDGMDVVDAIAGSALSTDPNLPDYLANLPAEPVIIEKITVVPEFAAGSEDLSDVAFLYGSDGKVVTYHNLELFSGIYYTQEFSKVEYLGVDCLQWRQDNNQIPGIDSFVLYLAKDIYDRLWVFKYVVNEGTLDERIVVDAQAIDEIVLFRELADESMLFRLIAWTVNGNDIDDPANTITTGQGDDLKVETVNDFSSYQELLYPYGGELIETTTEPGMVPDSKDISYYHYSSGLMLKFNGTEESTGWIYHEGEPALYEVTSDGPLVLTTSANEQIQIEMAGPGHALLAVFRDPQTEKILEIASLKISDTNRGSRINIENLDTPDNVQIGEVILEHSIKEFTCQGDVNNFRYDGDRIRTVRNLTAGQLRQINAPNALFGIITADQLGDPDINPAEENVLEFNVHGVGDLDINGDVTNIEFTNARSFRNITIDGTYTEAIIYAQNINKMTILNNTDSDQAVSNGWIWLNGSINQYIVNQGDVDGSLIRADRKIGIVELLDGNLVDSEISTLADNRGSISVVNVYAADHSTQDPNAGNIINSAIRAGVSIRQVRADGEIDGDCFITADAVFRSSINSISCGGDFGANVSSYRIRDVLVGFDEENDRLPENNTFTGSDYTGNISAFLTFRQLIVTGSITRDQEKVSSGTISTSFGMITNIFAEDGLDADISAGRKIKRILVGYINGRRANVANPNADVDGSVSTRKLDRIYFTGEDQGISLPEKSPIVIND